MADSKAGYRYLTGFMLSSVVYELTQEFIKRYFFGREHLRMREQMLHAARSGRQNIAEGYSQGTSLKGYIKLTGIAKGSFEELKLDYEDFLKSRKLDIWPKDHPKIREFRGFRVREISENKYNTPKLPQSPQESANLLITLISLNIFLLDRLIKSLEEKHAREGGFTEKLYRKRQEYRSRLND